MGNHRTRAWRSHCLTRVLGSLRERGWKEHQWGKQMAQALIKEHIMRKLGKEHGPKKIEGRGGSPDQCHRRRSSWRTTTCQGTPYIWLGANSVSGVVEGPMGTRQRRKTQRNISMGRTRYPCAA